MLKDDWIICEGENCKKKISVKNLELDEIADFLKKKEWGWLRGDELYDHYCSISCRNTMFR